MNEKTAIGIFGPGLQELELDVNNKISKIVLKDTDESITFDMTDDLELPLLLKFPPIQEYKTLEEAETRRKETINFVKDYCIKTGTKFIRKRSFPRSTTLDIYQSSMVNLWINYNIK